jgi:holliday junction DNA helicase RuvB
METNEESRSAPGCRDPDLLKAEAKSIEEKTEEKDEGLCPHKLSEYIGQKDLKGVLEIAMQAATARQKSLDHLLLYGPPGLGKTTISLINVCDSMKYRSSPRL